MKMIAYVVASTVTGEVEVSGVCQAIDYDSIELRDDQIKAECNASRFTHYYDPTRGLLPYTAEQRAVKAQMSHGRWDNTVMNWVEART